MPYFKKISPFDLPKQWRAAGIFPYFRAISGYNGSKVIVGGKEKIMIGSNNYLGLANHPEVMEAAKKAVDRYGAGCTGSRFLNGNMDLHDEMEEALARFLHKEAAVVFSTGFLANLGTIPTVTSRHGVIFSDRENHASITEGCNLALGKVVRYHHNDMESLDSLLQKHHDQDEKMIITDGVFSMNGGLAKLPELVALAKKYRARLYVDDAHSLGVVGACGRGTAEHFHHEDDVDIIMGTFSKSLASIGGFVAGEAGVMEYVKHKSRALIFSASIPPASVAVALQALKILQREPKLREQLHRNTQRARDGLRALGFKVGSGDSAIVPVFLSADQEQTLAFAAALFEHGLFSTPILPPATPVGTTLIRTSYMATHTDADIDRVLDIFAKVGKEFKLIPANENRLRAHP